LLNAALNTRQFFNFGMLASAIFKLEHKGRALIEWNVALLKNAVKNLRRIYSDFVLFEKLGNSLVTNPDHIDLVHKLVLARLHDRIAQKRLLNRCNTHFVSDFLTEIVF